MMRFERGTCAASMCLAELTKLHILMSAGCCTLLLS